MKKIRMFKAEKLNMGNLFAFVETDGSNADRKILEHWENNFKNWGVPHFIQKKGDKLTLWKEKRVIPQT